VCFLFEDLRLVMSFLTQQIPMDQEWLTKLYDSVAYEVSILAVFSFSLVVWKSLSRTLLPQKAKKVADRSVPRQSQKDAQPPRSARPGMTPKALQQAAMEIMTLSQEHFTRALRQYRDLVRQGEDCNIREEAFYFSLVSASIRVGHQDVVREILQRARENKVELSVQFFQGVLKLLASKHLFTDCILLQQTFAEDLPIERTICSCISLAATEVGQPEIGIQCVDRLRSAGEEITGKDYQNIFKAYAKAGNHCAAQKLFELLIKTGVPFEPVITNIVLATCVASKNTEIGHALLVNASKSDGAIPVDVVSYNTILKGYARQHELQKCFDLIDAMHATGVASDEVTYSTILDACVSENCLDKATDVIDSFISSGMSLNTVLYTTFMKGFVRMDMLDKAMALYRQMRNAHVSASPDGVEAPKPDVILYSVLIKANCDQRLLEPALNLAKDMIEDGLQPDDMIINRLLDGCRHVNDGDTADKIFKEFIESGKIKPSLPTLSTMVKIYGKCSRVDEAARMLKMAPERFGLTPNVVLYTCLMSACTRNRALDLAVASFDEMIKAGICPDAMTYSTLFRGCASERDWKSAVHIARIASNQPRYQFPAEQINEFLSVMNCNSRDSLHAEVLRALLRNSENGGRTPAKESVAPWRK